MMQVTVEDFLANATVYFANLTEEGLIITENGRQIGVLNSPPKIETHDLSQRLRDVVGPLDLPENFCLREYLMEERWKDYEGLD